MYMHSVSFGAHLFCVSRNGMENTKRHRQIDRVIDRQRDRPANWKFTRTHTQAHRHTYTRRHTHTCTNIMYICIWAYMSVCINTHSRANTRGLNQGELRHRDRHTHTHAHTHTHTHTIMDYRCIVESRHRVWTCHVHNTSGTYRHAASGIFCQKPFYIHTYIYVGTQTHTCTHTHWRLGILAKTPGASDAMLLFLRSSSTAAAAQDPTEDSCKASSSEKVQPPNGAIGASPVELLTKRKLCIELM